MKPIGNNSLSHLLTLVKSLVGKKADSQQSTTNSGKYWKVGDDGNLTFGEMSGGINVAFDESNQSLIFSESDEEGDVINVDAELKDYMLTAKPAIASAIINKGGTVDESDSLGDYATRISDIPNGVSAAATLPVQTTLTARSTSSGVVLNWRNVNADSYLIVRKIDAAPNTSADGVIVYNDGYSENGYTDTSVNYGNMYYYRIFPRNSSNQYQSTEEGSIAVVNHKDRSGQATINDLSLGDTIKFGQYGTSLLTWTIVDTLDKSQGYVTVACNQHAVQGVFDNPENDSTNPNPNTDRKNNGNNRWAYSNARQFLNTDNAANSWFVAQHEYDVKPSYSNQNGFLYDFTDYEKNIIITKTNITDLTTLDGGGSETTQDKIWLPSMYAMGLGIQQPLEDDHIYESFIDNDSRSYSSNYWLRTINSISDTRSVRYVTSSGTLFSNSASFNSVALRAFCLLPTSAYMTWSESDTAYIFADDSQRNVER